MAQDVDDSIIDSWEDADAEELERRMEERKAVLVPKQATCTTGKSLSEVSRSDEEGTQPVDFSKIDISLPLKIQDSERTEYVSQIKILKRPDKQITDGSLKDKDAIKAHKSLAEREAAYASARERILGGTDNADGVGANKQQIAQPLKKKVIKSRQEPNQVSDDVVRHPKIAHIEVRGRR